jgi:hypothetical protein
MTEQFLQNLRVEFDKVDEDTNSQDNYELINLLNQIHNSDPVYSADTESTFNSDDFAQSITDHSFDQELIDEHLQRVNTLASHKNNGLRRLFVDDSAALSDTTASFTSDTSIEWLGGLSLWQMTLIVVSILVLIGKFSKNG